MYMNELNRSWHNIQMAAQQQTEHTDVLNSRGKQRQDNNNSITILIRNANLLLFTT